jgi:uncharacterized protein with ATP-grasp and redox domains
VQLFHACLWGNRTDLSYMVAAHLGGTVNAHAERENLLVDDTAEVWRFLASRRAARLVIIADNAGTELLTDLALADFLLGNGAADEIILHLKPQPFFVSDAMPQDVLAGLFSMAAGGKHAAALAGRLVVFLHEERLKLAAH